MIFSLDQNRWSLASGEIAVAGMRVMAQGWEGLNGGRGQYISQLEDKPTGKPTDAAHCRSMSELYEKAARKGFDVHRNGF